MISEPSRLATAISITSLYPRQILLKNLSMKYKNSFQSPENGSADKTQKPEKKKKTKGIPKPGIVLQSIAAYLKKNGFSKTLLAFQSESHIEIDAGKEQALDLDDMCHYYLKRSETPIEASIKDLKELDTKKDDIPKDGGDPVIKERKEKTSEDDETESNSNKTDLEKQVSDRDDTNNNIEELHKKKSKEKKKKKSKMVSDSLGDTVEKTVEQIDHESKSDELHTKSKVQKKKNKLVSDCSENIEPENGVSRTETLLPESSDEIQLNETNLIFKDKKKKKHKSESNLDKIDSKKGAVVHEENGVDAEKKGSKKRKRSSHEEKESLVDSQDLGEGTKVSKMEGSKDNKTEKLPKENGSLYGDSNLNFSKKRKVEKSKKGVEKFSNTSLDKGHECLTNGEDDGQRKEDGSLGTNGGGEPTPKTRKELKASAEPKTVNSFQRVKVEKVQFADERLQDNSYWAKDGADIGYGAKAQEILGQVRGRDFRHEKTKKKRGSYRGGLIDLQSHSIKFNYSEEE